MNSADKLKSWINEPQIDVQIKKELIELEEQNLSDEISDRFYKDMEFGTGGMRGKVGAGTNRMNIHTVRRVSQAFAEHLLKNYETPSVVIAHDNRWYSDVFTFEAACVYAANGIKVSVFKELTPTPMLSYAVRHMNCSGGVVITASHNSKEYNGYKIYDCNGCQCLPEEALSVASIMETIDTFKGIKTCAQNYTGDIQSKIDEATNQNPLIHYTPLDVNESYYKKVLAEKVLRGHISNVSVVYTPLNGTGNVPVTTVLNRAEVGKLHVVKTEQNPDPDFTTCPNPNPEEEDALKEGLKLCKELRDTQDAPDILIATDPDCDRVGVVIHERGNFVRIDGNQVGILLLDFIISRRKEDSSMPENPLAITTVVSTPMTDAITYKKQIHLDKVLTGFKFIGGKIDEYEKKGEDDRFIFGFEESCGYLCGTYVRDKDAVSASLLIAEMVGYYKKSGKTLVERLDELYKEYGYFITKQKSFEKSGVEGSKEIKKIMKNLRLPEVFEKFSKKTVQFLDYEEQMNRTMGLYEGQEGGCSMAIGTRPIDLPKENVLEFNFLDYSKAIIRPSGTEPKIKIYLFSKGETRKQAEKRMDEMENEIIKIIKCI